MHNLHNAKDTNEEFRSQNLNWCENCSNVVDGAPLVLQDIQANASISINVWMKHPWNKPNNRGFVRIILGEVKSQLESTSIPWSVLRSKDESIPMHDIVILWSSTYSHRRIFLQSLEIPHQSLFCWSCHCCWKFTDWSQIWKISTLLLQTHFISHKVRAIAWTRL